MKLTYQIRNDLTATDYYLVTNPSSKTNIRKFVRKNECFDYNVQETLRANNAEHSVYTIKLTYKPYGCETKTFITWGVYFGKDVFVQFDNFDEALQFAIDRGLIFNK